MEEIFSHRLDAKAKQADRGFFDFEVDLSKFAPGKICLELETDAAVTPERNTFNTAGFTNPIIVAKSLIMDNHRNMAGERG